MTTDLIGQITDHLEFGQEMGLADLIMKRVDPVTRSRIDQIRQVLQ
jgi:hypothetical protein